MLWKFYDAHKEKNYQIKVRKKTCYEESSGQMNNNDDDRKFSSSGEG